MDTQVRTPQLVFMQPQRLVVPLFQRPYVWNEENQWEPLWQDVARMAERYLLNPAAKHYPHFLGAVVLQQVQNPCGSLQERTIIDGQQRLTTLQLLFDALHAQLVSIGETAPAMRIETLVVNNQAFCKKTEDRFKVWPTNRDREAFNEVMAADIPISYSQLKYNSEKFAQAHGFFSRRISEWLRCDGKEQTAVRAGAIDTASRELLQMVVIDLNAEENAQEIFETLNARGAQLTAADLIKNFIFQQLLESGSDVELLYEKHWKVFETGFWEAEVSLGRSRSPRSSVFLTHWLISQTGEEIVAREVFSRFKRYSSERGIPMPLLVERLDNASKIYRRFVEGASVSSALDDRINLFAYRSGVLESEIVKPLILFLEDAQQPAISSEQLNKSLSVIESWMVRRMLVRANTKNYNQVMAELIRHLRDPEKRKLAGDSIETFLRSQASDSRYWPDDREVRETLRYLPAYRRLQRGRLRMVLEAIEDHLRGWTETSKSVGAERVSRGKYVIEHIMPRKWAVHWPHPAGAKGEVEREALIHTLGNLTLLTSRLNSKVSNGPWEGVAGKREALDAHDVLLLNRTLFKGSKTTENSAKVWSDDAIKTRTEELVNHILSIWPVPQGHRSEQSLPKPGFKHRVDISDLISRELLHVGQTLYPRRKKHADRVAIILSDGRLDVGGVVYSSPSEAGKAITKKSTNGWWFFLVDPNQQVSLRQLRTQYLESISAEDDDDDAIDEDDDE